MMYSRFNVTADDRKVKDVLFTDTYSDGTENDVLLRFLNRYDDSDEIDTKDISKLLALAEPNIKYKIKSGGLRPYYNLHTGKHGRLNRRIIRARVFQLKEIIRDNEYAKECRKELISFLDDRVNPDSPNYGKPINLNDVCTWDDFPFDKAFTYNKIKDLFREGLCRGIIRLQGIKMINNLLRAHMLPFELEHIGTGNKLLYKVHEVKLEPMVIKIYR